MGPGALAAAGPLPDPLPTTPRNSTMIGNDKAFRIPCSIQKSDGSTVHLDKSYVQADQGSDMNVISNGLVK